MKRGWWKIEVDVRIELVQTHIGGTQVRYLVGTLQVLNRLRIPGKEIFALTRAKLR